MVNPPGIDAGGPGFNSRWVHTQTNLMWEFATPVTLLRDIWTTKVYGKAMQSICIVRL